MLRGRKFYMTLSLPELRHRQRINAKQTIEAYRLAQEPYTRYRGRKGLIRLQRIALLLADVVGRKCFPEMYRDEKPKPEPKQIERG